MPAHPAERQDSGGRPTHWMAPGVPHDGFPPDSLMRSKAVVGAV
ncbi:hypothetical protein ACFZAG_27890 [Streptomyces sp. NPDC012403]|nr:hypothetical protein [Streptomyces sp. AC558_RSS880]